MSRRWLGSVLLLVVTLLAAACSSSVSSTQGHRSRADDPAVQVDSSQLRKLKAAAGIEDCPVSVDPSPPTAEGLPDITLPCLGGGRDVDIAGLRGTPLVLNFWSQTCGPCRAESPRFQDFHQAAGDKVRVVGVDWLDPRPAYAIAFADELGLTYPQLADPEGVTRAPLRITALPITILVSADGRVVHREYGAIDSVNDLSELVADHLGESIEVVRR